MLPNLFEFNPVCSWSRREICEKSCIFDNRLVTKSYWLSHGSETRFLTSQLFIRGIASVGRLQDWIIFLLIYVSLEFLQLDIELRNLVSNFGYPILFLVLSVSLLCLTCH